jgi:hypothetical protein
LDRLEREQMLPDSASSSFRRTVMDTIPPYWTVSARRAVCTIVEYESSVKQA